MDWEKAESHIRELQEACMEIGIAGQFALYAINMLIARLESGERSQLLYDEIMECN